MQNNPSPDKYLQILRSLNLARRMIYRKMTRSMNDRLTKMFSKLSLDSESNASELSDYISDETSNSHLSEVFGPARLVESIEEKKEELFDQCRTAEWRLLRFYEELITNPQVSFDLRTVLSNQREKVMSGYENLNLLSRYPW